MIYTEVKIIRKRFRECSKRKSKRIINFKKKKIKSLTSEKQESCEKTKSFYICGEMLKYKCANDKKCCKVRFHCHHKWKFRGAAYSIYYLKYSILWDISVVFYNWSNYDYHLFIKELAEEFDGQFTKFTKYLNLRKLFSSNRKKS